MLGILLAGIVALNVATLSLTATAGKIDAADPDPAPGELGPAGAARRAPLQRAGPGEPPARSASRSRPRATSTTGTPARGDRAMPPGGSPRRARRPEGRRMRLIERRIGLLFAAFLLCFLLDPRPGLLAAGRARGPSSPRRPTVPADRDGHGARPARAGSSTAAATSWRSPRRRRASSRRPTRSKDPGQTAAKLGAAARA